MWPGHVLHRFCEIYTPRTHLYDCTTEYLLSEKITLPPIPPGLNHSKQIVSRNMISHKKKKKTGHAQSPQGSVADDLDHHVNYITPVIGG